MDRILTIARRTGWYWRSLMGDNHYRRYVAYRERVHPGEAVVSEGDYWRLRHATAGTDVRCC